MHYHCLPHFCHALIKWKIPSTFRRKSSCQYFRITEWQHKALFMVPRYASGQHRNNARDTGLQSLESVEAGKYYPYSLSISPPQHLSIKSHCYQISPMTKIAQIIAMLQIHLKSTTRKIPNCLFLLCIRCGTVICNTCLCLKTLECCYSMLDQLTSQ